uniref:Uncharacterized protein n=1 Tax=Chromera velia CCMP2878 TaxID=1169474 RepID=A0A0G4IBV3_9ALVE|eukprot:Cvel_12941.t1-p1 / transcript=Cvel_12941.t1 / gene=Cvel_12941 / organism=Chromera_velia_CCMP2878 / gene_product=hypothetical protein / transcript_product=hypothetical protein / location=Cvel_scaffold866:12945-17124(-) / protein_length=807 / sequence_SO=supercontig / SO=protein_coding / is_pseudo=false
MLTPPQAEPQQISETGAAPPDESVNGATGGTGAARRKSHDASPVDPTDPSKSRRNSTHSSRPGVSSRPPRSVPFGGGASPSSSVLAKAKSNHAFGSSMNAAHASQSAPHRQPSRDLPLPLARQKSPKKETSLPLPPGRRRGSQSSEKSEGLRHASGRAPAPSGGSGALMGPPQSAASSRPKTMRAKSMGIGLNSPSEKEKEKGHHGGTNAASSSTASAAAKRAADLQRARTQSLGERHKQKRASEGGGSPSTVAAAAAAASSAMSPASSAVSPSSHQRQRSSMRKPSIVKDGPTSPTLSPSAERPHKVSFPDEREGSDTVRHRPGPFSPSNQGAKSGEPSSSSVLGRSGAADSQGSVPGSASRFSQGRSPSSGMARHASRVSSALETMQEVENEDEDEEDEGEKGDKRLGRSAAASSAYGRGPPNNASYFSSMGKTGTQSSFAESRPPGSRKGSMRGSNIIKKPIKGAKSTVFVSPGIESRRNSEEEDDDESGGMNSSQQSQQIEEGEEVGDDSSNEERSSEFTDGSVFYGRGKSSMSEIDMAALGATFGQLPGLRKSNKSDTAKSITKSVTSALSRANTGKSGMSQSGRDDRPNFKAQASRAESGKSFSRAVSVAESSVAPASLGGGPVALGGERASIGFSGQGFVGLGANRRRSSMTSGVLSQPRGSVGNIASLGLGGIDEEGAPSHSLNPALDLEALRGLGGGRGDRSARPSVASGVGGPPGAGGRVRRASMFAGDMAHGGMGGNLGFAGPVGQGVPQSGIGFGPGVGKSSNVGLGIPGGLGVPGQGKASEAKIGRMMTMRMDM